MKKTILGLSAFLICSNCKAQVSLGPVAGGHAVIRLTKIDDEKITDHFQGFQIGVAGDIALGKHFSLWSNLMYERYENVNSYGIIDMIGLFCAATYKLQLKKVGFFYVGAGPYLVTPAKKYTFRLIQYIAGPAIKISDERLLRPFGAGAGLSVGFQSRVGIFFNASFKHVLTNMRPADLLTQQYVAEEWRYYDYGVSAGYLFKLSKKKDTPDKPTKKQ